MCARMRSRMKLFVEQHQLWTKWTKIIYFNGKKAVKCVIGNKRMLRADVFYFLVNNLCDKVYSRVSYIVNDKLGFGLFTRCISFDLATFCDQTRSFKVSRYFTFSGSLSQKRYNYFLQNVFQLLRLIHPEKSWIPKYF